MDCLWFQSNISSKFKYSLFLFFGRFFMFQNIKNIIKPCDYDNIFTKKIKQKKTIIRRPFRRPLLFGQVVMMFPNLRWSFRCFVAQLSVLTIPLLSFSKSFQVLSCWYLLRPDFHLFVWCIDWVLLSWLPTLAFLSWKGLQPEFPISWRFRFSCVPMLWLLCRQVAFAFLFPVISSIHALWNWTSNLCQEKNDWLRISPTWNIQVSKRYNHILSLAWLFYKTIKSISSKTNIVSTGCVSNRFKASSFVSNFKSTQSP